MNRFPLQRLAVAALAFGLTLGLNAQDEDASAAPAAAVKPRPAEMAGLASKTLLLGVVRAGDQLVAVGDRGNILLSTDAETWTQVATPANSTLTAVAFADAKNGWAVGHDATILNTVDGGKTWTLQKFAPELDKALLNVIALDTQRVLAFGAYGLFLASDDGGKTWAEVDAPAILEEGLHLNAMIRLGTGEVFLAGETGLIGISPDGKTWERLTLPYEGSLFGALPRGEKGAMVFGLRGNVLVTDDVRGGAWTPVDIGSTQSLFGGTALADGRVVLVGAEGEVVFIGADGAVRRTKPQVGDISSQGSGSLSAVTPWKDRLLVVGELGTRPMGIAQ